MKTIRTWVGRIPWRRIFDELRRLLLLFLLTVVLTVAAFKGVLAHLWMLATGNLLGFPR